jgi:hypothetical protein
MDAIHPVRDQALWQALEAGAAHFDQGRFWHAHESWEDGWRAYDGPDRHYLRGLIQLAAAGYHLVRGRSSAAQAVLRRAPRNLSGCDPLRWPFDTGHLLCICAALEAGCTRPQVPAPPRLRLGPMLAAAQREAKAT